MITRLGAAFTAAAGGDMGDPDDRRLVASALGLGAEWALAGQVHAADVQRVDGPGLTPACDGLITSVVGLPLAVRTADCVGVVLHGDDTVGVAHAGWRGVVAGVVSATADAMSASGGPPTRAVIGPAIGPCCFEVGPEVVALFGGFERQTTWGTPSVDLAAAVEASLGSIEIEKINACTRCGDGWFSHREDGTARRLAAIGWVP